MPPDVNELLIKIIKIQQSEIGFSEYFRKHNVRKVIVYGVGTFGKILISVLERCDVEVLYCIDEKVLHHENYVIRTPEEIIEECDAIIVSPIESKEIVEYLCLKSNNKIYTFVNIINETFNFVCGLKKLEVKPYLEYLILNILDHCNLRCKGCDHFACIAEPYFVSYEKIYEDLNRLNELFQGNNIMQIAVMGGEPLLHPDLLKILQMVRGFFPKTVIRLTTNGLLLLKQTDVFWRVCRENEVTIVSTKYPISLDYTTIQKKAKMEDVQFRFFEGTGDGVIKKSFKKIINVKGDNDSEEAFKNCHISNYGNFLMEGKLYGCPFSCQSYRIFNKKYDTDLQLEEEDYLDIYKIQNKQEIFDFVAKPRPYCRYCDGLSAEFNWSKSEYKIEEWIEGTENDKKDKAFRLYDKSS